MAAGTKFEMDMKKVKEFERRLDPKVFKATVDKHLGKATALNGKIGEKMVRQAIVAGNYAPNAALTVMLKGSSKPLVGIDNGIFQAITSQRVDSTTVFIGVLRTNEDYNIALAVHDGISIRVTPKMRGMFYALWKASEGAMPAANLTGRAAELWERAKSGWKPLKQSTTAITIPPRRFIEDVMKNPEFKTKAHMTWSKALEDAYRELAQGLK